MDATPLNTAGAKPLGGILPSAGRPQFGQGSASALSMKWSALHDAANTVGLLAGMPPRVLTAEMRNFPALMRDVAGWRRELAEQGIEDLAAIMEPGLAALLSAHARGADPGPPARALWEEFHAARDALLGLLPPEGAMGRMRRA